MMLLAVSIDTKLQPNFATLSSPSNFGPLLVSCSNTENHYLLLFSTHYTQDIIPYNLLTGDYVCVTPIPDMGPISLNTIMFYVLQTLSEGSIFYSKKIVLRVDSRVLLTLIL